MNTPSSTAVSPLETFSYLGRAPLRVFGTAVEPLFIAKETCEAIGLTDHVSALKRVPQWAQGVGVRRPAPGGSGKGGSQIMATLTEAGLYYLVLRSDKPEAEAFQHWVCLEVLPSIRRHGLYAMTGGLPPAARKVRELELEIEAQRYLLAADETRRRLLLLRGGLPPPAPEDVQTVSEWCAAHRPGTGRQELLNLAGAVKAYARRKGHPEYRRFPTGNPRYSQPAWLPAVIAAALDFKRRNGGVS